MPKPPRSFTEARSDRRFVGMHTAPTTRYAIALQTAASRTALQRPGTARIPGPTTQSDWLEAQLRGGYAHGSEAILKANDLTLVDII